mmetsp:Transcript_18534/g.25771  ORF Transcript_18534/g.25771 Transcript_18534/m.25771 type:complete len:257 (-) Transcript_18534:360-1130(-)|eukprot:CAMPEP_0184483782 /NCGR_PEP_ID=MMETSP0113_2-20130426/5451_1 /TAXON_ID=91329 /ORGANISM="Norrisiella sphaerica, Strain BC52" /LENGTH=256 /DNA_ID=CAMNT_0026864383 /DNA_START=148 /DNA_END=918 /DNA_ORIENTATION=+
MGCLNSREKGDDGCKSPERKRPPKLKVNNSNKKPVINTEEAQFHPPETPLEKKWVADTPRTRKKKVMRHIRSPSHSAFTGELADFGMKWKVVMKESAGLDVHPSDEFKRSFMKFQLMSLDEPSVAFVAAEFTEDNDIHLLHEFPLKSDLEKDLGGFLAADKGAALIFLNISEKDESNEVAGFLWVPETASEEEKTRYKSIILKTYMKLLTSSEPEFVSKISEINVEAAKKRLMDYTVEKANINEAHAGIYSLKEEN